MSTASEVKVAAGGKLVAALGFPSGPMLEPGGTVVVPHGDLSHPAVAGWVASGLVEVHSDSLNLATSSVADKAVLVEKAKTMGLDVDGRWGVDRLAAEIAAVEATKAGAGGPDGEAA